MNTIVRNKDPRIKWAGIALIAIALIALPFVLAMVGTAWVRITNFAILFVLLSLGLNIVVGFAGLLDLGYIAFYASAPTFMPCWRHRISGCTCRGG